MKAATINIPLSFDQVMALVKQLTPKEKLRLSKELQKETLDKQLTALLSAFKTDNLTQDVIDREAEIVRAEIYASRKKK